MLTDEQIDAIYENAAVRWAGLWPRPSLRSYIARAIELEARRQMKEEVAVICDRAFADGRWPLDAVAAAIRALPDAPKETT